MREEIREEWLERAVAEWAPTFTHAGHPLPEVRVSCGFGWRHRESVRGQCVSASASADGRAQIFIDPRVNDSSVAIETLVHELVHAADDCKSGHRGRFCKIGAAVGLTGPPWRSAGFSGEGAAMAAEILGRIGSYPHAALRLERKQQPTRMLKLVCPSCGYVARTTKQWLEQVGSLRCPCALVVMDVAGGVNVAAVTPEKLVAYELVALEILSGIHGGPVAAEIVEILLGSYAEEIDSREAPCS